jgi:hypothetical protein
MQNILVMSRIYSLLETKNITHKQTNILVEGRVSQFPFVPFWSLQKGFAKSVCNSIAQTLFLICPKKAATMQILKITSANAESTDLFPELRVNIPLNLRNRSSFIG